MPIATDPSSPLLEVRGVSKQFSGVRALDGVSLTLARGEVLAIVGENGAGKSTLMRIVAGVTSPTAGTILVDGEPVEFKSVAQALKRGISLIHQELNLADNLSVAANIFLGREPRRLGMIDKRRIDREAQQYLDMVGLDVSPQTMVSTLSIGKQQLVEIAKALSTNARILIMDEPTSSLSEHESQKLFSVVSDLRSRGVSVLYISHRLHEVEQLADRVVVLRDGKLSGELSRGQNERQNMVRLMVGREVTRFYHRTPHAPGEIVASVNQLRTTMFPRRAVSFELRAGEVVGLAGLVGAGRSELLGTLFGVTPAVGGGMTIGKLRRPAQTVREAIAAGITLAPEDRRRAGLFLPMSVKRNLSLASLRRDQRRGLLSGFLNRAAENDVSATMIKLLRIKTASDRQVVRFLSGGNQQKVVLGKWLCLNPRLLLLDEPTRGIDVGAKEEIYKLIDELAGRGVAILFASSELEEIMGLSDRTLVMHEGRIAGELSRADLSEEAVMRLATGGEERLERIGA
ncbi:MAG TPA: sugar ABC transporter ATP-binding protein [Lacipirellulaceae bacterium]|jgi:ribose transport system ATP-binding protein|nr:sugar ABC transporter ATP-binding protein [Lacipirellulaceae bacterium]